jgi:hypothetical protein
VTLTVDQHVIHKNRGKGGMVMLIRTDIVEIQMKTKTKMGPVDTVVGEVPKDDCFSRLDNWRKLLNNKNDQGQREIRFIKHDGQIVRADVLVRADDPQDWDSKPLDWPGQGWIPFYLSIRPRETVTKPADEEPNGN